MCRNNSRLITLIGINLHAFIIVKIVKKCCDVKACIIKLSSGGLYFKRSLLLWQYIARKGVKKLW